MNASSLPASSEVTEQITAVVDKIVDMPADTRWKFLWDGFVGFLPKLLTALIIFAVGLVAIRLFTKFARAMLQKSKLDPTLHSFTLSILNITLYVLLGVIILTVIAPKAAVGLVTLMGVFGLAISLAVKDSLANLAGGMSVLFTKPFSRGDYVKINATEGTIEEIRLNYTVLKTFDNKVVHIPNGDVAKAEILNYTCEPERRLDLVFSIGYGDDFELAKRLIREALAENPLAHVEPEPIVRVTEHASSTIKICCKVWCGTPDYWALNYDLLEEVKRRFDASGISMPFPQMDVYLKS